MAHWLGVWNHKPLTIPIHSAFSKITAIVVLERSGQAISTSTAEHDLQRGPRESRAEARSHWLEPDPDKHSNLEQALK